LVLLHDGFLVSPAPTEMILQICTQHASSTIGIHNIELHVIDHPSVWKLVHNVEEVPVQIPKRRAEHSIVFSNKKAKLTHVPPSTVALSHKQDNELRVIPGISRELHIVEDDVTLHRFFKKKRIL